MNFLLGIAATAAMLTAPVATSQPAASQPEKPKILLVHGAFADASSWNGVVAILERDGYCVIAGAKMIERAATAD